MIFHAFLFLFLIYSTNSFYVPECCNNGSNLLFEHNKTYVSCENEDKVELDCLKSEVEISHDTDKFHLLPEKCTYTSNWACMANMVRDRNTTTQIGILYCPSSLEKCERNIKYDEQRTKRENIETYFIRFFLLLNSASIILLLLTSATYFLVPQMADTHGTCVRHYTLTLALAHICITSPFLKFQYVHELCVTHVYLTIFSAISSFLWMNLLSFSTWRSVRGFSTACNKRTLITYCCIGYGIPSLTAFLAFIKVVIKHWTFNQPNNCFNHQRQLMNIFLFIPIPIVLLLNTFYFVDSIRRLLKDTPNRNQVEQTNSVLRSIRFRVCLHFKLFIITGTIWVLFGILIVSQLLTTILWYMAIVLVVSSEGIFIFIVLVAMRKRVIRGLAQRTYFGIHVFPSSWRNFHGSETGEDDVGPVHYSNNNDAS